MMCNWNKKGSAGMATKEVNVIVPKGYFMSWFVTYQTSGKVSVCIEDRKKVYLDKKNVTGKDFNVLSNDCACVENDGLKVRIGVEYSEQLLGTPHSNDILTDSGDVVGKEFTLCLEDYVDNDYNDVCISIIAWKGRG